jgi:hypothetical protein
MPEVFTPPVRIHRVTTRRRTLRVLNCPLEPELLVAEFAGELPPEVTIAVREHIAVCDTCGARSQALRAPYELLSSLGREPVPFVPDLRDSIRAQIHANRFLKDLTRAALTLGRGGALGVSGVVGVVVVFLLLIGGIVFTVNAHGVSRSQNALTHVLAAGNSGVLLVETDKLVPLTDAAGRTWQVAEVIAVDQRTGAVLHSLPASNHALGSAQANELPVATQVSRDGGSVYEVTAPASGQGQALVAFDAATGVVRFITLLALPGAHALSESNRADALALAPDGYTAYVGLYTRNPTLTNPRVLVVDAHSGAIENTLSPGLGQDIPMPPPPGSLPVSVFPQTAPTLDTNGLTASLGADGQLIVSPDGLWLFDLVLLSSSQTPSYGVVRRIDTSSGMTVQALALQGDFPFATLAISEGGKVLPTITATPSAATSTTRPSSTMPSPTPTLPAIIAPQLYVVQGGPDAEAFVLDPGITGPTLEGDIALGGPVSPPGVVFTGTVRARAAADGTHLYIAQDATGEDSRISPIMGHDLWMVDTQGMSVVAHRLDLQSAGDVLTNASSAGQYSLFILSGGTILLAQSDLTGSLPSWLNLDDGHAVTQFLASTP